MFTTKSALDETKHLLAQANARADQNATEAEEARRFALSKIAELKEAEALLNQKKKEFAALQALLAQTAGSSPFIKIGSTRLLASSIHHIESDSDDVVTAYNGKTFTPSVPLRGSDLESLIANRLNRKK